MRIAPRFSSRIALAKAGGGPRDVGGLAGPPRQAAEHGGGIDSAVRPHRNGDRVRQQVPRAVRHAAHDRERQVPLDRHGGGDMAFHIDRQRAVPDPKRQLLGDRVDHPSIGIEAADLRLRKAVAQGSDPGRIARHIESTRQPIADNPVADP